jgi:hypothetical protein
VQDHIRIFDLAASHNGPGRRFSEQETVLIRGERAGGAENIEITRGEYVAFGDIAGGVEGAAGTIPGCHLSLNRFEGGVTSHLFA